MNDRGDRLREQRMAENEVLHREVNEAVAGLAQMRADRPEGRFWLCECGDSGCTTRLRLTREQYEQVRADTATFFVARGHELPEVEDVVRREEEFLVVRKKGLGRLIAEEAEAERPATAAGGEPRQP